MEFENNNVRNERLIKELKEEAGILTMYELHKWFYDKERNSQIYYLKEEYEETNKLDLLNSLYKEIDEKVIKTNQPLKSTLHGIYGIKNSKNDIQYFVLIPLGRNGGKHNFCEDYMKTLYEIYQILDKECKWTSLTCSSSDICDDLYNFVITFILK